MRRRKSRCRWVILLCAIFGLLSTNCGDSEGHEVVYLHVFNAYPGAQAMSLYGPAGAVVTDLPYGTRTENPVAVDRNLGTNFELVLDGAPTTFDLDQQLYSLYPQETATFLFSRRQDNAAHAQILRHIQSVSAGCRLVFHNSLALANDNIGEYSFIVGWNFFGQVDQVGYNQSEEDSFVNDHIDELGDFHVDNHIERVANLYGNISDHPVFALAQGVGQQGQSDLNLLNFVWLGQEKFVDPPQVDFGSGNILTHPPTIDYIECLEGVIEGEDELPDNGEEEEEEDDTRDCTELQSYTATTFGPGGDQVGNILHYYPESLPQTLQSGEDRFAPGANQECGADLRIYSDYANIFFGDPGFDNRPLFVNEFGQVLSAEEDPLIRLFPRFSRSDHQFYVVYGRPVDPDILSWRASDELHPMDPTP